MKKKRILSAMLAAAIGLSAAGFTASAAEHQSGAHDFGDPFAPYLNTQLVMKTQIEEPTTVSHTSKNVQGSAAVTADIIESSAQFYTRDNGDFGLNDGSLDSREYGNIKNIMFAYMYEPAEAGTYPAILFLHGGGGTADTLKEKAQDFAAKGYVTMAIDIPSLYGSVPNVTVNGQEEKRSSGKYASGDSGDRFKITEEYGGAKNSDLVDAEIGVIQAFNYLAGNEKTDTANMGIMGSSWGGYSTTLVTGILGSKVKAAYSQYGSGFYGPTPGGTKYDSFWTDNGYFPTDQFAVEEWYSYLDPSAYLDNITANYYLDAAAKDTFYRPKSVEATLDLAENVGNAASTNHVWSYLESHKSISESDTVYSFMDYYLKGEGTAISKTEIVKTELMPDGSNKVHIAVDAAAEPESVKLVYSKNDTGYTSRTWNTINAVKTGDEYTATVPAGIVADGVEYYALTKDSDKAAYSSSLMKTGFTQKISVSSTPVFTVNGSVSHTIGSGTFTATVPVVNNDYAQQSSVKVILALYNNGALEKTAFSETESIAAGESAQIPVSIDIEAENIESYSVKLMIWDGMNTIEPYSRAYSLASIDTAPTAPEELKVTDSGLDGISIAWTAASDNIAVEGYDIYRKSAADDEYEKLATASGNALSYTDSLIEVNETYDYRVMAFDGSGNRSEAAEVTAKAIEGAKVILNQYNPETGADIAGYKMSAHIEKDNHNGTTVEYKPAFKPLQDETVRDCIEIVNGTETGTGKYIQLKVDDDYISPELDSRVAVMVTFNDINFDKVKMQYSALDGNRFKPVDIYSKLNEQRWMTKTYIIEDAKFDNSQDGGYDLRVNFDLGTTNDIAMIQVVNLSEDFAAASSDADSIELTWKNISDAQYYELYRDGELIAEPQAGVRTYTDAGLEIDTEYTYTLKAVTALDTHEVGTITASTLKRYIAEVDFHAGTEENMRAVTSGFVTEVIDNLTAVTTDNNSTNLKLAVDSAVAPAGRDYLVTFKYNDCGNKLSMRVGMTNCSIDRAHYFYTNGTGEWETATVLMPAYTFNNKDDDIWIRTTTDNAKYAITDVKLSECPSYDDGASYVSGVVSGVTVADGILSTALTTFKMANNTTSAEVTEVDGQSAIKINSTEINSDGLKRAEINIVPDYRLLGQDYNNALLPGAEGYEDSPAAVRPVTVKVTYYKNNTGGTAYIKGAKYDEESSTITNPDNDGVMLLQGGGEWATAKINIDDYYVQGSSISTNSPIKLIISGVPADEDIIIGKIEITNRDYSTKIGEYSVADPAAAQGITAAFDEGIIEMTINGVPSMYTDVKDVFYKFSVDKTIAQGVKDRFVTITYNDCGAADVPVRVSMVNNAIDGAHYFYTRGTGRWETTTVLIPEAEFKGNENDITIKLVNDETSIAIAKIELFDGTEHSGSSDNIGAVNASGIASGMTIYNGMLNSTLATWNVDTYTTVEPVKVNGVDAFKLVSSKEDSRAELRIMPDYRFLGQTDSKVYFPAAGESPEGKIAPIKVRITYYRGSGTLYVKGSTLKADQTGLEWTTNHGAIALSSGADDWETVEVVIDDYYLNGGSDTFRTLNTSNSYIQFITNGAANGTIIRSIEIVNN